jgi:hypothetical protein
MNEAKWLAACNPIPMLQSLRDRGAFESKSGRRRLRLFGCACCRKCWHLIPHPDSRSAVEAAERFADGVLNRVGRKQAQDLALAAKDYRQSYSSNQAAQAASLTLYPHTWQSATLTLGCLLDAIDPPLGGQDRHAERDALLTSASEFVRDIFTFPLGQKTVKQITSGTANKLAEGIYSSSSFDRLPILADALEEGGLSDVDILSHLRSDAQHARGCWALDNVLRKP